jgi:hypothetical protein
MEPKAYYSAVDGEDEALGIIGPQFNAPLFWILSSALIVWFFVILALSFIHMVNQRKKEDLKRQLQVDRQSTDPVVRQAALS